ncbi:hypothetical protein A2U01_0110668, partial [Trifolium medium]|nr:hypothetical protein [Trifolium medium]
VIGDQPVTRAGLERFYTAIAALTAEITTLTNRLNNNNNATTTNHKVDEVEQFHDVTRDSQQDEVVDSEVN